MYCLKSCEIISVVSLMTSRLNESKEKKKKLRAHTSPIRAPVIIQVVSVVVADLLLRVGEHGESLTHLLEFLFLLLLHLWSRCAVAICVTKTRHGRDKMNNHHIS